MEQLAALLLLTALCGFDATAGGGQDVQDDADQFDRFLVALAECKTSSAKLSRVSCIIEQVFPHVQQWNKLHHLNGQVEAYMMDKFIPSTMAERSELTFGSWKSPGGPNAPLSVLNSLARLHPSVVLGASAHWLSKSSQRKLLATGGLRMPSCKPTATPVLHSFNLQYLELLEVATADIWNCLKLHN